MTTVGTPHEGAGLADFLVENSDEGGFSQTVLSALGSTLGFAIDLLSGADNEQDTLAALHQLSSAGMDAFTSSGSFSTGSSAGLMRLMLSASRSSDTVARTLSAPVRWRSSTSPSGLALVNPLGATVCRRNRITGSGISEVEAGAASTAAAGCSTTFFAEGCLVDFFVAAFFLVAMFDLILWKD